MRLLLVAATAGLALLVTGCAGAPVGWGGTHRVDASDAESITISYDLLLESLKDVTQVAKQHCSKYNKKAQASSVYKDKGTEGLIRTYTFLCVENDHAEVAIRESSFNHPSSLIFYKKKPMTFYSEPSGAEIFTKSSESSNHETFICQTPCTITVDDSVFNNRPEIVSVVGARWASGAYRWESIYISRGAKEHFTFRRPSVGGDVRVDEQLAAQVSAQQPTRINGGDIVSALVLGAHFWAAYKGYGDISSAPLRTLSSPPQNPVLSDKNSKSVINHTASSSCSSDYQCDRNERCVKAPLEQKGVCLGQVDEWGMRQDYSPNPSSLHINTQFEGVCRYDTDCSINFKCDPYYKVCILPK